MGRSVNEFCKRRKQYPQMGTSGDKWRGRGAVLVGQWLASLAFNHRLSPLCVGSTHASDNTEDLSQYDPGF